MSKKQDELQPSDRVMVEFGAKTHYNANTGEHETIDPAKTLDVPYSYFLEVTRARDEYNEKTGYAKTLERTVKLAGLVHYEEQVSDTGAKLQVPTVKAFDTDAARDAAKKAAEQKAKDDAKAEAEAQKKANEAAKAKADFDAKQAAQAEQQKREAAQKAADLAANKTPDQAKAIANAISESTDKVNQGIDDSGEVSAPVTNAVAKTV